MGERSLALQTRTTHCPYPVPHLLHSHPRRYGQWLDINVVAPDGPDACTVRFEWWVDPALLASPGGPAAAERCLAESAQIQDEDAWLCARVQKGVASTAYGRHVGLYAPTYEAGEHYFHRRLADDLDAARRDEKGDDCSP